jgi:hypothetical protein
VVTWTPATSAGTSDRSTSTLDSVPPPSPHPPDSLQSAITLLRDPRGPDRASGAQNDLMPKLPVRSVRPSSDSVLSLWSQDSVLSIGSVGSVLSVGSVGSALSVGSIGSALSLGSIGSSLSLFSTGSWLSTGSLFSAQSRWSVLSWRSSHGFLAMGAVGAATGGVLVLMQML